MKQPTWQAILLAIFDKRLYGSGFFLTSGPPLVVGLVMESAIIYVLNRPILLLYVPMFFAMVLVSGLGSKNFAQTREVPNMGYLRGYLFLIVSALAIAFPFYAKFSNDIYGLSQFLVTFSVSIAALTVAIVEVAVLGQRVSLRNSIHLHEGFFKQQKRIWEKGLEGFPNSRRIIEKIDDGSFLIALFDRGSFNLAVLWSCNVMEEIVDVAVDGIIQENPTMKSTFKNEKGGPQRYPLQLGNLNFVYSKNVGRESEQMSVEDLWDKVRNPIAHHKYKPTFDQTFGALTIFVRFMEDFPETLQSWKSAHDS